MSEKLLCDMTEGELLTRFKAVHACWKTWEAAGTLEEEYASWRAAIEPDIQDDLDERAAREAEKKQKSLEETRGSHLQWCKDRAFAYFDANDPVQGIASFLSDMRKHEITAVHPFLPVFAQMYYGGMFKSPSEIRKFINDFN